MLFVPVSSGQISLKSYRNFEFTEGNLEDFVFVCL